MLHGSGSRGFALAIIMRAPAFGIMPGGDYTLGGIADSDA